MKPVTLWYRRLSNDQNLEFNHMEDGHTELTTPVAIDKAQANQWKNGEWDFEHAFLDDKHRVVRS